MKNIIQYAVNAFLSFAFIALSFPSQANDINFKAFYVFGDSLSDTGNDFKLTQTPGPWGSIPVPPSVNYYNGRFSNGPVAFEYLWKTVTRNNQAQLKPSLGNVDYAQNKGINFSYGGATTEISNLTPGRFQVDGLVGQVENFIKIVQTNGTKLDKHSLYALWAGANDYLLPPDLLMYATKNPDCQTATNPVVCNITDSIDKLYSSVGARYFLVPNLPNLGYVPIVNNPLFYNPLLFPLSNPSLFFKELTISHNSALKSALDQLEQSHPGIHIIYVDTYTIMNTLISIFPHGSEAGPAGYCLFTSVESCAPPPNGFSAPGYVFWDAEHPTTAIHSILAAAMFVGVQNEK
jgi:phospholipase/lecithinase/hemolysin